MSGTPREPFSPATIDAFASRAGLTLDTARREELLTAGAALDRVLARLQCYLPRAAEPAHVFSPLRFLPQDADRVSGKEC